MIVFISTYANPLSTIAAAVVTCATVVYLDKKKNIRASRNGLKADIVKNELRADIDGGQEGAHPSGAEV